MIKSQATIESMSKTARDALVDKLRAFQSPEEILSFESSFNSDSNIGPLHTIICDFLRTRSISRGLAAKWLNVLLNEREERLKN